MLTLLKYLKTRKITKIKIVSSFSFNINKINQSTKIKLPVTCKSIAVISLRSLRSNNVLLK